MVGKMATDDGKRAARSENLRNTLDERPTVKEYSVAGLRVSVGEWAISSYRRVGV